MPILEIMPSDWEKKRKKYILISKVSYRLLQSVTVHYGAHHQSPHISTNKYAKVGGEEYLAIKPAHLISLHPIFAFLL